jgi:hypothetical protein
MVWRLSGRRNKFGVRIDAKGKDRRTVDNITFDSIKEARRYQELKLLAKAGEIGKLELQPRFTITVAGEKICDYVADFKYQTWKGKTVIEDAKGWKTPDYRLKKKLMKAVYKIEILES